MSFKIATFTAHVDSYQIFKTSNLIFCFLNLDQSVYIWRSQMHLYLQIEGGYLRVNQGKTGQHVAEPNKWSMEAFLLLGLMFPPRYIRLNLSSSDILQWCRQQEHKQTSRCHRYICTEQNRVPIFGTWSLQGPFRPIGSLIFYSPFFQFIQINSGWPVGFGRLTTTSFCHHIID